MKFSTNIYTVIFCLNRLTILGAAYLVLNSGVKVATATFDTVIWSVGIHQSRSVANVLKAQKELTVEEKSQLLELNTLIEGLQNDNWINRKRTLINLPLLIIGLMAFSHIFKEIKNGY